MFLISLVFPLYFYTLLNKSYPLLDPFDSNNDTLFHTVNCPDYCSGSILDLDKRMCWDYVQDDLFLVDIFRPITSFYYEKKKSELLGSIIIHAIPKLLHYFYIFKALHIILDITFSGS